MPRDWARLRQVMYQPSAVWLSTDSEGRRWLTDQFVVYDVTGFEELGTYDFHVCLGYDPALGYEPVEGECTCPDEEVPDGPYQLTVSKGFKPRVSVPEPDIRGYLALMGTRNWRHSEPSEWSVAEHPGKAMLWIADWTADSSYCLLGESTWTALKRNHPGVLVEWAPNKGAGVFRFLGMPAEHQSCLLEAEDVYCGHRPLPFAYAAGIRVPEGQEGVAAAMVRAIRNVPVELDEDDIHDIEVIEEAA